MNNVTSNKKNDKNLSAATSDSELNTSKNDENVDDDDEEKIEQTTSNGWCCGLCCNGNLNEESNDTDAKNNDQTNTSPINDNHKISVDENEQNDQTKSSGYCCGLCCNDEIKTGQEPEEIDTEIPNDNLNKEESNGTDPKNNDNHKISVDQNEQNDQTTSNGYCCGLCCNDEIKEEQEPDEKEEQEPEKIDKEIPNQRKIPNQKPVSAAKNYMFDSGDESESNSTNHTLSSTQKSQIRYDPTNIVNNIGFGDHKSYSKYNQNFQNQLPQEYEHIFFMEAHASNPWGIGINLENPYQQWKVTKITPGQQAAQQGIKVGWRIIKWNYIPITQKTVTEIKNALMQGSPGAISFLRPKELSKQTILLNKLRYSKYWFANYFYEFIYHMSPETFHAVIESSIEVFDLVMEIFTTTTFGGFIELITLIIAEILGALLYMVRETNIHQKFAIFGFYLLFASMFNISFGEAYIWAIVQMIGLNAVFTWNALHQKERIFDKPLSLQGLINKDTSSNDEKYLMPEIDQAPSDKLLPAKNLVTQNIPSDDENYLMPEIYQTPSKIEGTKSTKSNYLLDKFTNKMQSK